MKAIKITSSQEAKLCEVPRPQLRDDYVLVRVVCVALNPTDWKHIDFDLGKPGCTVGCDFSGVIEEVGSEVKKGWKKGDRIASSTHGSNQSQPEDGCFAEYCVAKGDLGMKIPDDMTFEDACTLPIGVITCGQSFYQNLGDIPLPGQGEYGGHVLIYGGSTATGTLAIQSGCKVVATASPRNVDLLKQRGADGVFDYNDPNCAKKIREYTDNDLTRVLDCIAEGDSPRICEEAVSSKGGKIAFLLNASAPTRQDIVSRTMMAYSVTGEACDKFGRYHPANIEDYEYAKSFCTLSEALLGRGRLVPHPATVEQGGLRGVFDGMQQFRDGKVSGEKLVYRVEET